MQAPAKTLEGISMYTSQQCKITPSHLVSKGFMKAFCKTIHSGHKIMDPI